MAGSHAQIGWSTQLKLGNGASPEVFTAIKNVNLIPPVGFAINQVEVTDLESPGKNKEWIAGLGDGDTLEVECRLTPENQAIIYNWVYARVVSNWQIDTPGTLVTRNFAGSPASWHEGPIQADGVISVKFGIKITGDIT